MSLRDTVQRLFSVLVLGALLHYVTGVCAMAQEASLTTVQFRFDEPALSDTENLDAKERGKINEDLVRRLEMGDQIIVEGHADDFGSEYYNYILAARRACHVLDRLVDMGLDVTTQEPVILSFGSVKPKLAIPGPKKRDDARIIRSAPNRRVEISTGQPVLHKSSFRVLDCTESQSLLRLNYLLPRLGYRISGPTGPVKQLRSELAWSWAHYANRKGFSNTSPSEIVGELSDLESDVGANRPQLPCPSLTSDESGEVTRSYWYLVGERPTEELAIIVNRLSHCYAEYLSLDSYPNAESAEDAFQAALDSNYLYSPERLYPEVREFRGRVDFIRAIEQFSADSDGYSVPRITVTAEENAVLYQHLGSERTTARREGVAQISAERLRNVCRNLDLPSHCADIGDVREEIGSLDNQHFIERYVFIPDHYDLVFNLELPSDVSTTILRDLQDEVVSRVYHMQGRNGYDKPFFFGDESWANFSSQCGSDIGADLTKLDSVLESYTSVWESDNTDFGKSARVQVVEKIGGEEFLKLDQLGHPVFENPPNARTFGLLGGTSRSKDEDDCGHALHVASIVGNASSFRGWGGLATAANTQVMSYKKLIDRINDAIGESVSKKAKKGALSNIQMEDNVTDIGDVINVSGDFALANNGGRDVIRRLLRLARQGNLDPGISLILAAPPVTGEKGCENDLSKSCCQQPSDLACMVDHPLVIGVAPLTVDRTAVFGAYKLGLTSNWASDTNIFVGSPGQYIVGADYEEQIRDEFDDLLDAEMMGFLPETEEANVCADSKQRVLFGYRARCGSSFAAPVVSALAARLASSQARLRGRDAKARIMSCLEYNDLVFETSPSVRGVVNFRCTLETVPYGVTFWNLQEEPRQKDNKYHYQHVTQGGWHDDVYFGDGLTEDRVFALIRSEKALDDGGHPLYYVVYRTKDKEVAMTSQPIDIAARPRTNGCELSGKGKNPCYYDSSAKSGVDLSLYTNIVKLAVWQ